MLDGAEVTDITRQIIGAAIEVHRLVGPGLLESTYRHCLTFELTARGIRFIAEQSVPVVYKTLTVADRYRVDLVVENLVVVELKAVEHVLPVHHAQLLTYLRATNCPCGLLINFNVDKLTNGIKRVVNMRPAAR
jgi:GxxExxY protein